MAGYRLLGFVSSGLVFGLAWGPQPSLSRSLALSLCLSLSRSLSISLSLSLALSLSLSLYIYIDRYKEIDFRPECRYYGILEASGRSGSESTKAGLLMSPGNLGLGFRV